MLFHGFAGFGTHFSRTSNHRFSAGASYSSTYSNRVLLSGLSRWVLSSKYGIAAFCFGGFGSEGRLFFVLKWVGYLFGGIEVVGLGC